MNDSATPETAPTRWLGTCSDGMTNHMIACSFDNLVKLLDKQLDLDSSIDVYNHLDCCDTCRDAVYHIKRDRDEAALIFRPFRARKLSAA